jgi:Protein of unknown function (DUF3168)
MSTRTSLAELQPAIFAVLTNDTQLMAIVTGVFDFAAVPTNQAMPYVTLGSADEGPMNEFSRRGYESTFTLDIWDNTPGFKRCQAILGHMNRLLDQPETPLTLASQHHVGTWYQGCQELNDPGVNSIRHVPVRYQFDTQE